MLSVHPSSDRAALDGAGTRLGFPILNTLNMMCAASQSCSGFSSLLGSRSGLLSVEGEVHSEAARGRKSSQQSRACTKPSGPSGSGLYPQTLLGKSVALQGCLSVHEDQDAHTTYLPRCLGQQPAQLLHFRFCLIHLHTRGPGAVL